jgi:hypothetical protein
LSLIPATLLFAPGQPTNIVNIVQNGQKAVAIIAVIAWHILDHSFFVSL